jgi:hypothetical protein
VKYTNEGAVHIRVKHGVPMKDYFYFEVEDTGAGIADENFSKIFEPFTQLHQQRSYIEGTGLGLSITKNLVELMKGKIYFKSKLNKGSVFIFELPLPTIIGANSKSIESELLSENDIDQNMELPGFEILNKIVEFAKTGNFTAIEVQIEQLLNSHNEYDKFCNYIKECCSKYNDDRIIAYCSNFLNKT